MNVGRLLISPPAPGAWNMAVDGTLLETAEASQACTLRFYKWDEPTLSLGYFQGASERETHAASVDCPMVRRATGGGAIIHDRELTYSLVAPATHFLAADTLAMYRLLHGTLVEALAAWGAQANLCGEAATGRGAADEPFLCFQRRAVGDVLCARAKIAGSAQRRRRGAILQHGSVLLERSQAAPELAGLRELTGVLLAPDELAAAWLKAIHSRCDVTWEAGALEPAEVERADQLVDEIYNDPGWTLRR